MNQQTEHDLRTIYASTLNPQLLNSLIDHLRIFWNTNQAVLLPIKTRNENNELLGYFSVFHQVHPEDIVLFAGGIEKDRNDNDQPFPVIRFDGHNVALKLVDEFRFEFRKREDELKSNRVCVKLREETIDIIPILFWCQLQWFDDKDGKK